MFTFILDVFEVAAGVVLADLATKYVVKHQDEIKARAAKTRAAITELINSKREVTPVTPVMPARKSARTSHVTK